ncbi:MAG: sulfate/thiosulfate ABC transporter permease CysW, partial [Burkholderiales bacterium]
MLLSSRATSDRVVATATTEPRWVQVLLISAALLFLAGFLFLPLL